MKSEHLKLDQTDRRIILELKQNCRRSYRELASVTGMSPAALIERIKKLEQQGVITGYSANFNFLRLGYEFMAIIQIGISGDLLRVQQKISRMNGVASVYDMTGRYDSMAVVMCKNRSELSKLIKDMRAIPGVEKTNTDMVLNVVKKLSDFDISGNET
ncbi:Lrp/AsnC family transcriptional regulator [Candidatus Micrarchaeota archaeon]|nr:Lrp/AsnC family transcriptional regulator [Candidatus Micrarchaeota archaeon]